MSVPDCQVSVFTDLQRTYPILYAQLYCRINRNQFQGFLKLSRNNVALSLLNIQARARSAE